MRWASPHVPDLQSCATEDQRVQEVKVLLGVDPGRIEEGETPIKDLALDMKVAWPAEYLTNRVPFACFYPTGEELQAHLEEARKWMGHDD